ncbi:hypothetical protein Pelo_6093 [Pelomyxa schiedti]|nr:hypothetical protein Pelo_6093 [Pelomyxa schiedti]
MTTNGPDPLSSTIARNVTDGNSTCCAEHGLKLDLFCETDQTVICQMCSDAACHKGHRLITAEDLHSKKKPVVDTFLLQLSNLHTDLCSSVKAIELESSNIKQVHSEIETRICKEFAELISRLQKRQEELLSQSREIASSKVVSLSKQQERIAACIEHVEKYTSKCESILKTFDPVKVLGLCESIPGLHKQLECKPEHLSPCANAFSNLYLDDIEPLKAKIPQMGLISLGPILSHIKEEEETPHSNTGGGAFKVTLCGRWQVAATKRDICVRVGESECTNVNIFTPGSVLTFTVPENCIGRDLPVSLSVFGQVADRPNDTRFSCKGPEIHNVSKLCQCGGKMTIRGHRFGALPTAITVSVNGVICSNVEVTNPHTEISCSVPAFYGLNEAAVTLAVAGQSTTSTVSFDLVPMEWDCGRLLAISPDDKSIVHKPPGHSITFQNSTATATTQLNGDRLYEWHLSISDLKDYGSYWVGYGLIPKPVDHGCNSPYESMYGWSTTGHQWNLPRNTRTAGATGGTEEVTLRYDARTLALTATWPLHDNATATVNNVPRGLYPAVIIHNQNSVQMRPSWGAHS